MMPIVKIPNEVLITPAANVVSFDKRLSKLVEELKHTLKVTKNPKGVGLAAPQVGVPLRIFLVRPTEKDEIRVFINAQIIQLSSDHTDGVPDRDNKLEGCLSIPNIWGKVYRAKKLNLKYQDEQGGWHQEEFRGFPATIIQHETDHTNGILFTHRVLEQKGVFYQSVRDNDGKEILEEIELK